MQALLTLIKFITNVVCYNARVETSLASMNFMCSQHIAKIIYKNCVFRNCLSAFFFITSFIIVPLIVAFSSYIEVGIKI